MKRWVAGFLVLAALAGCSSRPEPEPEVIPDPIDPPAQTAPEPSPAREPTKEPVVVGQYYGPDSYPSRWASIVGPVSPDGLWEVRTRMAVAGYGEGELWAVQTDGSRGFLVSNKPLYTDQVQPVWTLDNRLLFYVRFGDDQSDLWYTANPQTGEIATFHPERLQWRFAGRLTPLPDGEHLLVTTNFCGACNKPSANTLSTYLMHIPTGEMQLIGVDVDVEVAEDGTLTVTGQLPHFGYSGPPPFFSPYGEHGTTTSPVDLSFQIAATDRVEFRIFHAGAGPDSEPLVRIPAINGQSNYNRWGLSWVDAPPGEYRIETWAQVRAGAPDTDEVRRIGGERWLHLGSTPVRVVPASDPVSTVAFSEFHMIDRTLGWGYNYMGQLWRTRDGGGTWLDITPDGAKRCDGRLMPRYAVHMGGERGVLAVSCSYTDATGLWATESSYMDIYRSEDLGRSWQSSRIRTPFEHAVPVDVVWVDSQHGWVLVGEREQFYTRGSVLYRTQDGGRTWESLAIPGPARDMTFVSHSHGWMSVPGGVAATSDGGETWRVHSVEAFGFPGEPVSYVQVPHFHSERLGVLSVGPLRDRKLFITTDLGETWHYAADLPGGRGPVLLSEKLAYLWEYETRSLHWSRDGGSTWSTLPSEISFVQVQFLTEIEGFGVDLRGSLYKTADGGASWTKITARR